MVARHRKSATQPFLTRRQLIRAGTAATALTLASGCRLLSTDPAGEEESGAPSGNNPKESPTLTRRVEAGDLPKLADRLPEEPLVIEPTDRIGGYGGTWHTCTMSVPGDAYEMIAYDGLLRWAPTGRRYSPTLPCRGRSDRTAPGTPSNCARA